MFNKSKAPNILSGFNDELKTITWIPGLRKCKKNSSEFQIELSATSLCQTWIKNTVTSCGTGNITEMNHGLVVKNHARIACAPRCLGNPNELTIVVQQKSQQLNKRRSRRLIVLPLIIH